MEGQHFPRVADEEILKEIAADGGRGAVLAEVHARRDPASLSARDIAEAEGDNPEIGAGWIAYYWCQAIEEWWADVYTEKGLAVHLAELEDTVGGRPEVTDAMNAGLRQATEGFAQDLADIEYLDVSKVKNSVDLSEGIAELSCRAPRKWRDSVEEYADIRGFSLVQASELGRYSVDLHFRQRLAEPFESEAAVTGGEQ